MMSRAVAGTSTIRSGDQFKGQCRRLFQSRTCPKGPLEYLPRPTTTVPNTEALHSPCLDTWDPQGWVIRSVKLWRLSYVLGRMRSAPSRVSNEPPPRLKWVLPAFFFFFFLQGVVADRRCWKYGD